MMGDLLGKLRCGRFLLHTFKGVTFLRAYNALLLVLSYFFSRLKKKPVVWGKPFAISVEPTTSCNLRCPECPSGLRSFSRATGNLSMVLFAKILEELHPTLAYLTLYFQGEPYLNPAFFEMVKLAAEHRVFVATSTNAHFLNKQQAKQTVASGLGRLIISIDGADQASYGQYRIGGNLEKVIAGTQNVLKLRKERGSPTPEVVWQFIVFKHNEAQIPALQQLAKEVGVDRLQLKSAQIYDFEQGSDLIPTNEKYARYVKKNDGSFKIKHEMEDSCWKMWHSCTITWDGQVVPCCFDKDAHYKMGDLQAHTFSEVWTSKAYQKFRQQLLFSRKQIDICQNCTEGAKVWL